MGGTSAGRAASAPAAPAAGGRRRGRADDQQDALFTSEELTAQAPAGTLTPAEQELVAAWDLDAELLLAERDRQRRRGEGPIPVMLPARLSVSALVALARDPDELARQVRRPMPHPPPPRGRRRTP